MPVPTHDATCETKTFATRCYYCRRGSWGGLRLPVLAWKRLGFRQNAMGRALLGRLVAEPPIEFLIRDDTDPKNGHTYAVTCRMTSAEFQRKKVSVAERVSVRLVPHAVADKARFWLVAALTRARKRR